MEKTLHKAAGADQHPIAALEVAVAVVVVVVGVTGAEEGEMMYPSCLLLVSPFQEGVLFVEIRRTLQTFAQIAVGRSVEAGVHGPE